MLLPFADATRKQQLMQQGSTVLLLLPLDAASSLHELFDE
jgi:hypothetical protein